MVSPRDLPDILDVHSLPGCCRVGTDCFMAKITQLPKTVDTFLKSLAWLNFGSRASPRPGRRVRIVARNSRLLRATRELSYESSHIVGVDSTGGDQEGASGPMLVQRLLRHVRANAIADYYNIPKLAELTRSTIQQAQLDQWDPMHGSM
jgi:hypothetical protein